MAVPETFASSLQATLIQFHQHCTRIIALQEEKLQERESQLANEWASLEAERKIVRREREQLDQERERLQRWQVQLQKEREELNVERTHQSQRPGHVEARTNAYSAPARSVETVRSEPAAAVFASRDIRVYGSSEGKAEVQETVRSEPVAAVFASRDIRVYGPSEGKAEVQRQVEWRVNRHRIEPPEPDRAVKEIVVVTDVAAPDNFMVQLVSDRVVLTDVMMRLKAVGENPDLAENQFRVGRLYCGQFTADDEWYRVKVNALAVDPNLAITPPRGACALVTYVDFGNSEWLPGFRMRRLPHGLDTIPPLAKNCALVDVMPTAKKWSDEASRLFDEVITDMQLEMKVFQQVGGVMFVDLLGIDSRAAELGYPQCSTARDVLIAAGHAVPSNTLPKTTTAAEPTAMTSGSLSYARKIAPNGGTEHKVIMSYCASPAEIYFQLVDDQYELHQLMVDIRNKYQQQESSEFTAITDPQPGLAVCCQFSADQEWYRAEIIEVRGPRNVSVVYVDYGNMELVNLSSIKKLSEPLISRLPAQALRCCLVDVVKSLESGEQWPEEVIEKLQELSGSQHLSIVVKGVRGNVIEVDLFEPSVGSVNQLLLQSMLPAQSHSITPAAFASVSGEGLMSDLGKVRIEDSTQLPPQSSQESLIATTQPIDRIPEGRAAVFTHIDSPTRFYVHLQEGQSALQNVMADVAEFCKGAPFPPEEAEWRRSSLCCARFSQDQEWYRARVLDVLAGKRVKVFYIDFGNSEVLSNMELRSLPHECSVVPPQAVQCYIHGVTPVANISESLAAGGWSKEAVAVMNELVGTAVCQIELKGDLGTDSGQPIAVDVTVEASDGQVYSLRDTLIQRGLAKLQQAVPTASTADMEMTPVSFSTIASGTHAKPALQYEPPRIPSSAHFTAVVTCVNKDFHIYAHNGSQDTNEVLTVTEQLQGVLAYNLGQSLPAEEWKVGQSCCAQFATDGQWYRARIVRHVDEISVEVFYVDFGNHDVVSLDWLHPEVAFHDIPCLCLEMKLQGLSKEKISDDIVSKVLELVVDQRCEADIVEDPSLGSPLVVSIMLPDGRNLLSVINEMMMHDQQTQREELPQQAHERPYASPYHPPPADSLPQPDKLLSLDTATNGWQDGVNATKDEEEPALLEGGNVVEDTSSDGSTSIATPQVALESSVDAEDFIQQRLPDVGVKFTVAVTQVMTPNTVYLQRLATSTSDQDVTFQDATMQLQHLQHIMEVLNSAVEHPHLDSCDLKQGMPCSARYSHDNMWYRARVVEILNNPVGSSLIKVMYVDYGTSETVTLERIRALPAEFHGVPAQAFVVNLPGIEPVPASDTLGPLLSGSQWSIASLKGMAELVAGKEFIAAIQSKGDGHCVSLTDQQGNELTEELVKAGLAMRST